MCVGVSCCVWRQDETPLHVASMNDSVDVARLLLEHKADVNAKTVSAV